MQTLIIETATEKGTLILASGPIPIAVRFLAGGPELSRTLAAEVKNLLDEHHFRPNLIAVGRGPGSFTGIRVGLALGQALSFGWKIPLAGFASLQPFAPPVDGPFAVLFDARSGGFYTQFGEKKEGKYSFDTPFLLPLSQAEEALKKIDAIGSPHPLLIQQRLKSVKKFFETKPDPLLLAQIVAESPDASALPFYCSNP